LPLGGAGKKRTIRGNDDDSDGDDFWMLHKCLFGHVVAINCVFVRLEVFVVVTIKDVTPYGSWEPTFQRNMALPSSGWN
jgi:hypothetical protein